MKKELAALKRSTRFLFGREVRWLAGELAGLLAALPAAVDDPGEGFRFMVSFYMASNALFSRCDDSNGYVQSVYQFEAAELFVRYAAQAADPEKTAAMLYRLMQDDRFGVRDVLLERAAEYLPDQTIRHLADRFLQMAGGEKDEYTRMHWYIRVELLARALGDAVLFEKTKKASRGKLHTAAWIDIAEVYFKSGDPETALKRLKMVEGSSFLADRAESLLVEIYRSTGQADMLDSVLYTAFKRSPSLLRLNELIAVRGEEQRSTVIAEAVSELVLRRDFDVSAALFMIDCGQFTEASDYIVRRSDLIDGYYYYNLLPMAQALEEHSCSLAASLIYRALLLSILERANTKTYRYGVRYLRKLDVLAGMIHDWQGQQNHDTFILFLHDRHGRKKSFWGKYDKR